ncbi:MAG: endopeptidase La, partial [Spirochaetales bacterium]|nr:endopeptidase La [Spirochaetales bacterium]
MSSGSRLFGPAKIELPLVPLKDMVVFPHMVVPFFAGRDGTIKALEEAMSGDRIIFLVCQRNPVEDPIADDLFPAGSRCRILQLLKLPDGTVRVLVEGLERGKIVKIQKKKGYLSAQVRPIPEDKEVGTETVALMATLQETFKRYSALRKKVPGETLSAVEKAEFPDKLVDLIAAHIRFRNEEKVDLLGETDTHERLEKMAVLLTAENEILSIKGRINTEVQKRMEKHQREYFLHEQLKQINKELGKSDSELNEAEELEKIILAKSPPPEVADKAKRECKRLAKLQPMSPESGVLRTYLEWLSELPWSETSQDNKDIQEAARILDEDHYNMKKPKERVLDFIAVRQLKEKMKGPILCFVGPPGTGKTSLGKSVARALNREFIRISLGGVRDEAEIRGHRKTYVGALPGKIIQSMRKAATTNPVFLLDEIDKINSDFRGDPASALLEVLDPEQNINFVDHYLEVPYNLSGVMFITTANSIHTIPYPLRDRMEIIEIPGYTEFEKVQIAKKFIIPKQLEENGLAKASITFKEDAILRIIRNYTMESGVRNLEREIASVIRKLAREAVKKGFAREADTDNEKLKSFKKTVGGRNIPTYLGREHFHEDVIRKEPRRGLVYGLAWTELGGTILPVEVAVLEGSGELILTGSLGDVMKESARTALSFLRAHGKDFDIPETLVKDKDIHIHVPEGAIPKDGPSAGITITAALLSSITGKLVPQGYAMTGEITLSGRVLAIGGLKEKVLAAHRNKMTHILLPEGNQKDLDDLPREV